MKRQEVEQGFGLVAVIVAIFLVMLGLSVAAPSVARGLRREREVEAVHRGNQYVRAIQLYYRKFGHYPGNMDQLVKSNNIRFLRQKYVDPMTGKDDWRLIHVGEQKTTVKGFFGQPLAGIASTGVGGSSMGSGPGGSTVGDRSPSPTGSSSIGGSPSIGASSSLGASSSIGANGMGSSSPSSSTTSGLGNSSSPTASSDSNSSSGGIPNQSASTFSGSGAPFLGVGSSGVGDSIVVLNEQTSYPTWEFIYDPRIEQLKAKGALMGGVGSGTLGNGSLPSSPFGSTTPSSSPASTTSPTTPASPTSSTRP